MIVISETSHNNSSTGLTKFQIKVILIKVISKNEHYLSTKKKKKEKDPWFQETTKDKRREKGYFKSKTKEKKKVNSLNFLMLDKKHRLKEKKDFEEVIKKGKFYSEDLLVFKKIKNNLSRTRVGFVVSQKVSKKAVVRNKIKRRLRQIIKTNLAEIKPGFDIIFFTKKGIEEKDFSEIKKTIEKLLKKAKLLND